jgi:hypothetical protein
MAEPTTTYAGVLNKVALFTFCYLCACTWLLSQLAPGLPANGGPLIEIDLLKISVPGYWLGALLLTALLFRVIKLHDRVSDITGLRKRYDIKYIIEPLFRESKSGQPLPEANLMVTHRREIMRQIFYKYTSVDSPNGIDTHFIEMAWEALTWLWVVVEAATVSLLFGLLCLAIGRLSAAVVYAGLFALLVVVFALLAEKNCIRQTQGEIDEILSDEARRKEIASSFDAIFR